jgi:organic hydroperoxide reductase OsmC/OhrA
MLLTVSAKVPGIDEARLNRVVDAAAVRCPISPALWPTVEIRLDRKRE